MPREEQETQEQEQEQDLTQNLTGESQPLEEQEQQTTDQSDGHTDDGMNRYVVLLEEQLREQNRQIQDLVNRQTTPATVVEEPDAEELKQRFYVDPHGTIRDVVSKELATAIAPLREFVDGMRTTSVYDKLKNKYRADPRFSQILADPDAEAAVDQIMDRAEKSDANFQAAVIQVVGLTNLGLLPRSGAQPNNQPFNNQPAPTNSAPTTTQPAGTTVRQPAHLRPSGSQNPTGTAPVKRRQLTELEKRLAREKFGPGPDGEEKYLNFLELSPRDVINADANGKVGR